MLRFRFVEPSGTTQIIRIAPNALASGGDGAIHLIEGEPALVAKLYHEPGKDPTRLDKVRAMLADPPQLPPIDVNGFRYIQMAWPLGWLENMQGAFAGYVMPLVDLSRATALENLLAKKTRRLAGLPESYGYRLSAAANLSALVAELHSHRHHIIDLKPINLNVYTDTFYMALLDCDGLSVHGAGGERFPAHQYSDGYICPEALQQQLPPQALGEEQDRFALAVILFQLLNQGLHPYQGVPVKGHVVPPTNGERIQKELYAYGRNAHPSLGPSPWSIHTYFDDETRLLFDRAFTTRNDRPSGSEWRAHLQQYTKKVGGKVFPCPANPEHVRFEKGCPWCDLESRQRQQPKLSTSPPLAKRKRTGTKKNKRNVKPRRNLPPQRARGTGRSPHLTSNAAKAPTTPPVSSAVRWANGLFKQPYRLAMSFLAVIAFAFVTYLFMREPYLVQVQYDSDMIIDGSGTHMEHSISLVPDRPTSGSWKVTSLTVSDLYGKVDGNLSWLTFVLNNALVYGRDYSVRATLKYTSTSGETATVERQWTLRPKQEVRSFVWPELRSIVPDKVFTHKQLPSGTGRLRRASSIKFSRNGSFVFAGASGIGDSNVGHILMFSYRLNNAWSMVGTLKPNSGAIAQRKEARYFWFGRDIEVSDDDGMVAALACVNHKQCNELHIYENATPDAEGPQSADVLVMNPEGEQNMFAQDFALSPSGDRMAVMVTGGIGIYQRNVDGTWRLQQMLPKPDLGDGNHLGGDVLFTKNGRQLLIGAPTSSRGHTKEGALLVYTVRPGRGFSVQPEYISPGVTGGEFGRRLALSGNGDVLAVSTRGRSRMKDGEIHIFAADNDRLVRTQVIKPLAVTYDDSRDYTLSQGLSLSYDGKRLLSGLGPYKGRHRDEPGGVQAMLYERQQGTHEYKPMHQLRLEGVALSVEGGERTSRNPPSYLEANISPDGATLLLSNSEDGSLSFFSLPHTPDAVVSETQNVVK